MKKSLEEYLKSFYNWDYSIDYCIIEGMKCKFGYYTNNNIGYVEISNIDILHVLKYLNIKK